MRLLIIILCLASAACNQPSSESQPTKTAAFEAPYLITDSGILVYLEADEMAKGMLDVSKEDIDSWALDVEQCLKGSEPNKIISTTPVIVRIVDNIDEYVQTINVTQHNHSLAGLAVHADVPYIILDNRYTPSPTLWKHEMIHLWLAENGMDGVEHEPEYLWQCQY